MMKDIGGWINNAWNSKFPWRDSTVQSLLEEDRILSSIVSELYIESGKEEFWIWVLNSSNNFFGKFLL